MASSRKEVLSIHFKGKGLPLNHDSTSDNIQMKGMAMNDEAAAGADRTLGKNWRDKCRLLDEIDAMREPACQSTGATATEKICDDPAILRERLHSYEQTCAMLEREVQALEQQTLAALAEAGRLRRELNVAETEKSAGPNQNNSHECEELRKIIAAAGIERRLLLEALENSESELARMAKTLDLVMRKLQVA